MFLHFKCLFIIYIYYGVKNIESDFHHYVICGTMVIVISCCVSSLDIFYEHFTILWSRTFCKKKLVCQRECIQNYKHKCARHKCTHALDSQPAKLGFDSSDHFKA